MNLPTAISERRGSSRFPIDEEIRYKVLNKKSGQEAGAGRTLNMSSSGILFTTEHELLPGRRVEIAVNWPAKLNESCPLKLIARGKIIRFGEGRAAIEVQQYEFRTQGAHGLALNGY